MKFILLLIITIFASMNLNAYSYAAAGKEPTIDAMEAILASINKDDFKSAEEVFIKYKKNYKYLNDEFNEKLYDGLNQSIDKKDKKSIGKWLNISIATEIERRLDGGFKNIKQFNVSKVMLAKVNKFYNLLFTSLNSIENEKLKLAIKKCTESIGNPGLFGVGAKPVNIEMYKKNQKIALKILQSL